jgi:hypothetical protein
VVVALAAGLLAGCANSTNGPPPAAPLNCGLVQDGGSLVAFGAMQGLTMALTLRHQAFGNGNPGQGFWNNANVTQLAGGNLVLVELNGPDVRIQIGVPSAVDSNGSFVLMGTLDGTDGSCLVSRAFTFVVNNGNVQIG